MIKILILLCLCAAGMAQAQEPPQALRRKMQRLQERAQERQRAGRDMAPLGMAMRDLEPLIKAGRFQEAEAVVDRGLALLGGKKAETAGSAPAGAGAASAYVRKRGLLVMNDGTVPEQLNQAGNPVAQVSIFTVRADGTGKKMLTGPGNQHPSWTPDGRIIFVSDRSGAPQIWTMDKGGGRPRQIGDLKVGPIFQPQLAKNGLIAFWAKDSIWIMRKDGSGLRKLVGQGGAPSLALSGAWLTYTVGTQALGGTHNEIFRINTDGTGLKQLTFTGDPDYPDANASAISPDESAVAIYTGKESDPGAAGFTQSVFTFGYRNVGIIPAGGGPRKLLTKCKPVTTQQELQDRDPDACIVADDPTWSTDGKWIVYGRGGKSGAETWMIGRDGKNDQRLSSAPRGYGRVTLLIQGR